MKDATKQFLKYRPNAQYIEKVEHRPNSNYQRRECITMSVVEAKNFGTKFITGWLVDNYNESINATPIIHHCWNIDKGVHYDTIPKQETKYDYVMDPDVNKPYSYQGIYYISPVIYLTDTELKIIVRDGRKATITEEEHKRFYNERQQEAVLQKMDKIRKE